MHWISTNIKDDLGDHFKDTLSYRKWNKTLSGINFLLIHSKNIWLLATIYWYARHYDMYWGYSGEQGISIKYISNYKNNGCYEGKVDKYAWWISCDYAPECFV